jgi:hypothetical protein
MPTRRYRGFHERFEVKRIVDPKAYRLDGACADVAADDFNCPDRAKVGICRHVADPGFLRWTQQASRCEESRRMSNVNPVNLTAL